jgi:hypothetical protein
LDLVQLQFGFWEGRNPQDAAVNLCSRHQRASGVEVVNFAANAFPPTVFESDTVLSCQFAGGVTNVVKKLQKRRGHSTVGLNGNQPKVDLVPATLLLHRVGVSTGFLRRQRAAVVPFVKRFLFSCDTHHGLDNWTSEINGVPSVHYPIDC